jgi:hypothetical protein
MAFHSRPYRASAARKRLCSSVVQYSRRFVSTYFLRAPFATSAVCCCSWWESVGARESEDASAASDVDGGDGSRGAAGSGVVRRGALEPAGVLEVTGDGTGSDAKLVPFTETMPEEEAFADGCLRA